MLFAIIVSCFDLTPIRSFLIFGWSSRVLPSSDIVVNNIVVGFHISSCWDAYNNDKYYIGSLGSLPSYGPCFCESSIVKKRPTTCFCYRFRESSLVVKRPASNHLRTSFVSHSKHFAFVYIRNAFANRPTIGIYRLPPLSFCYRIIATMHIHIDTSVYTIIWKKKPKQV